MTRRGASVREVIIRNGRALVGPGLEEQRFAELLLRDGRIAGFRAEGVAGDAEVVDAGGAFVLPGLVDAHVHFDLAAHPFAYRHWGATPLVRSATLIHNGLLALRSGITSVRDLGSADHSVLDYAAHVSAGSLTGPRVRAAGRPITMTGGHCSEYGRIADGPGEVRLAVREQLAAGATAIKLIATGGISTPGDPDLPQLDLDELRAGVHEAQRAGRSVAAHAHNPAGIRNAVEAGVDSVEHAAFADDASLELLVRSGTTLVPTVSALSPIEAGVGIPDPTVEKSLAARETFRRNTARAIAAGVRIAAGTDAGTALNPIGGLVDELGLYVTGGLTPLEALRTATVAAGELVTTRRGPAIGRLEEGAVADLLVVDGDPRDSLDVLRRPRAVLIAGRPLDLAWVDRTIEELAGMLD